MSAKDRVRTATEATAASVRQIRPLTLPDHSAVSAELREHQGRNTSRVSGTLGKIKDTWLIPLGAAAAVAALALVLVTLRHPEAASSSSPADGTSAAADPAAIAAIPRYYAIATEGPVSHDEHAAISVTVGDVRTGKTLTTVTLPAVFTLPGTNSAVGVSAAADDRTFVVARRNTYGGITYFQVHIAPGAKPVATVKQLPIPDAALGNLLGFAVSPDGKELAVLSVRGNGTTLRIYSVKSGATLRTWIAGTWRYQGDGVQQTGVSWTADSRQVAFSTAVGGNTYSGVLEERLIGATAPSGDLAAASKVAFKAPGNCSSLLLTPDGGTVVCATMINFPPATSIDPHPGSPGVCGKDGPMFVAYSAVTGKLLRVLYQYTGVCDEGVDTVLWSDDSARHVIGEQTLSQRNPLQHTDRYGVAAAGNFAKFQVAQHGQWYSGPAF
jgi:hypothetical protein